ncbi:MAG: carboxypeptidase-like regulatory domain-containing protein, partial [Thermoanaerobaculia bacterium]|nr:carboxypeptidase-like regulatory domain-containing protein [Thermoanaerobaculia bacterium]
MRSRTIFGMILAVLVGASAAAGERPDGMTVLGNVLGASDPIEKAVVVALNLTSYDVLQTKTDGHGSFRLPSLPAGIYRVVAVKRGFAPAIATVVPNRATHSLLLKLKPESMLNADEKREIWAIRRAIPPDILRELGLDTEEDVETAEDRFSARMMSVTGLEESESSLRYVRTAVGLTSQFNDWTVNIDGQLRTVDEQSFGLSVAEAAGVSMTVQSDSDQAYRFTTTSGRWLEPRVEGSAEVEFEAHRIAWSGSDSRIEVRYMNQDNLFDRITGSERIELAGEKKVWDSGRSSVDVGIRVGQFNELADHSSSFRSAELSADATHDLGENLRIGYGIGSRYSDLGSEWAPRTSARLSLGSNHSLIVSGLYKIYRDEEEVLRLPAMIFVNEGDTIYPRYRYSVGFRTGDGDDARMSAVASVAEVDSLVRILFDDRFDQFWDGLYLDEGDVHHDLTLRWHGTIARRLAIHFSSSAGWAESNRTGEDEKSYLTGTLQSL